MDIKIDVKGRAATVKSGGKTFEMQSIADLIEMFGANRDKIKKVVVASEKPSYTLIRQIYLLINFERSIHDFDLTVNSQEVPSGKIALPVYEG